MNNEDPSQGLRYGIKKINRYAKKDKNLFQKKNFLEFELKTRATIIKIESTKFSTFLLLCKNIFLFINILACGQVLSKGNSCLGREGKTLEEKKTFNYVKFIEDEKEDFFNNSIWDISAGPNYVLALDKNGHVWGWGSNLTKQIHPTETFVKNAFTDIDGEIIRPFKIVFLVNKKIKF